MFKYRQYIDILSDSLKAVIAQMTNIAIGNIHIEEIEKLVELYPIAHSMEYIDNNNKISGDFVLAFGDESTALMLASAIGVQMGLSPFEQFDNDASDLINEFINVVVGRAISEWDEQGLSVKLETPVSQKDIEIKGELVSQAWKIVIDINPEKTVQDGTPQSLILRVTFTEKTVLPLENMRILVVDDSRVIRGVMANTFTGAGCKVKEAQDGMEAIATHRRFRPDLTLMDINMPKMGGLDAIAEIRKADPQAKFVILSSSSKKDEVLTAKALNVLGYLIKPIQPGDLIKRIIAMMAKNS